ncbi:MAG TPA: hypothetical protein VGJ22_08120 [Anaerolineales bacterium]
MKHPWYYTVWVFLGIASATFITFGNALDVLKSNASVWITWPITIWGTFAVAALLAVRAFVVRVFRPRWVRAGQPLCCNAAQLPRLGDGFRAVAASLGTASGDATGRR